MTIETQTTNGSGTERVTDHTGRTHEFLVYDANAQLDAAKALRPTRKELIEKEASKWPADWGTVTSSRPRG